jgi:hypothetical protein
MIYIDAYSDKPHESGYKYIITRDGTSWTAYKTKRGFLEFLYRTGLEIDPRGTRLIKGGYSRLYNERSRLIESTYDENIIVVCMACKPRKVDETYFWNHDKLPKTAIPYTGLSNGRHATCYYDKRTDGTTLYMPNPNSKEVYDALDVAQHRRYRLLAG